MKSNLTSIIKIQQLYELLLLLLLPICLCCLGVCPLLVVLIGSRGEYLLGSLWLPWPRDEAREDPDLLGDKDGRLEFLRCLPDLAWDLLLSRSVSFSLVFSFSVASPPVSNPVISDTTYTRDVK